MRTHQDIIRDNGGVNRLRLKLGAGAPKFETVKSWFVRDSIPPEYWRRFSDEGLATLHELALAAEARGRRDKVA